MTVSCFQWFLLVVLEKGIGAGNIFSWRVL
jgi:hypothetical protein